MRILLLLAALLSTPPQPATPTQVPAESNRQQQVLVIYSTRRDAQIAVIGERELPQALDGGLGGRLDYYSEYIDPARFEEAGYQAALGEFLRLKYAGHRFDIVIAIGNDATRFVDRQRDTFAGEPPVVYFADTSGVPRPANATGVIAALDLASTVRFAQALDPELRHVYVITGADKNDGMFERAAREQLHAFEPALEVVSYGGLPTAELETRLRALPPHSAAYYIVVDRDGTGQYFHPLAYLERVVAAANAPTYSWVDSAMGRGIVGGSLKSQTAQMDAVAELALRVLRGEAAGTIAPVTRSLNVLQADWRSLRRWGFPESRLPAGTALLFRNPSPWERYRPYFLALFVVLAAQTALIGGLLVQRNRRRRAESRVLQREAQLRASYVRIRDLGARLLHEQDRERAHIARELHDDVSQQLALIEMDVKLLGDDEGPSAELLSRVQTLARSIRDLSHRLHPAKLRLIGIVAALKGLQSEMSQSGVEILFTAKDVPPSLPADVTVCLFRVAQEALQNAVKYSHGRRVVLNLAGAGDLLVLTVVDDGVGFNVDETYKTGLGLLSMTERVEAIGGTIHVRSGPGAGTRVEASVPIAMRKAGVVAV